MDTVALVEQQIDDGRRLLARLAGKSSVVSGAPSHPLHRPFVRMHDSCIVYSAGWVKPTDEDRWSFYICNSLVDENGPSEAYRQVYNVLRLFDDISISSSDIKLVGKTDRVTQDLLSFARRNPGKLNNYVTIESIGGISVEGAFVYSLREERVRIYGMVFRGEPSGALHLSFEPHDSRSTLVVENNGIRNEYPAEIGIDWDVAAPEGAVLERDETGLLVLSWNWRGHSEKSNANEVWSFAKYMMHGFRFENTPK